MWRWVLGIILLLIVLLCRTRVGIHGDLAPLSVDLTIGPIHIRLFPGKTGEKAEKKSKKEKRSKKNKAEKPPADGPKKQALTLPVIQDAVHTLAPPLKRSLGRIGRGIRLHPLTVSLTIGGREDPAAAAELYGYAHAAVWTGMPVLEQLLVIPDPRFHIGLDFDAGAHRVEGEVGISLRLGTLLAACFGIGIPALRWYLRFRKTRSAEPPKEEKNAS